MCVCPGSSWGFQPCWPFHSLDYMYPGSCWVGASEHAIHLTGVAARTCVQAALNLLLEFLFLQQHICLLVHVLALPAVSKSA